MPIALSQFNLPFPFGRTTLVFNSFSNAILRIPTGEWHSLTQAIPGSQVSEEVSAKLLPGGFLTPEPTGEARFVEEVFRRDLNELDVGMEISRSCNLRCDYCLQRGTHDPGRVVSPEVLSASTSIIAAALDKTGANRVNLLITGGEPWIFEDLTTEVLQRYRTISTETGTAIRVLHETNGTRWSRRILELTPPGSAVTICLSERSDHDRKRAYAGGGGSFDDVLRGLEEWGPQLRDGGIKIWLKYMLDHESLPLFRQFLDQVSSLAPFRPVLDVAPVLPIPGTPYENHLDRHEAQEFRIEAQADILDAGFQVLHLLRNRRNHCGVRAGRSLHVGYDGRVSACYARQVWEEDVFHPEAVLDRFFVDTLPFDEPACLECPSVLICGGPVPCQQGLCPDTSIQLKSYSAFLWARAIKDRGRGLISQAPFPEAELRSFDSENLRA